MAAKEMYDYLVAAGMDVTADYTATTLTLQPSRVIEEEAEKNVENLEYDDGSEDSVVYSSKPVFFVTLQFDAISEEDAGTLFDFYNDTSKGNATARSFQWTHYDTHTYVVRFAEKIKRGFGRFAHSVSVRLKVLGY